MWNQKDAMDAGRFMLHHGGWDDKSDLERYNPVHNPDFRVGRPYGGRGYTEPGFPGENGFNRGGFHRDMLLERDRYQMAPPVHGTWPPTRRTTYENELGIIRGPQGHAKAGYGDGYRDANTFRDADFREAAENYKDVNNFREVDKFREVENFREPDNFRDRDFERGGRFSGTERHGFDGDEHSYKRPAVKSSREGSWDRDYAHSRYDDEYDSDHEKEKRDRNRRKPQKRDKEKQRSKDRDESPERGRRRERSRSHGHEHRSRRSRSSSRGHTRDKRERSYEDTLYDLYNEKEYAKDEKHHREHHAVAPSATLVVKGLSQRTVEDDLYQALVDWGPLRHVRVIKERTTGTSRGFAFIDFPSVDDARKMMEDIGENGLVVDGRRLFFEYSKPTGGVGGPQVDSATSGTRKGGTAAASAVDWMCTVCGCVNFARRTSCFQCNEGRTDDAPPADVALAIPSALGKKGSEAGPTHVLIVRGLDENVNEEILHYEFSKYAPIKDLRLVRDKFTHISKGFAFVHFHSVEDATKALESSNGTTLDKSGQPLRVAYAKSIHGPGSSSSSNTHASNSLAATAIEAATFAQQYDVVGWAPKEYNPDQEKDGEATDGGLADPNAAPQAGFVWDEASGYYYDAVSGFYYDGHRGLYYDGNRGIWYSYNQETQQYEPYVGQDGESGTMNVSASSIGEDANHQKANSRANASVKTKDVTTSRKAVISAPPATIHIEQDAKLGLAETVKAAAAAAQATMKKDKVCKSLLPSRKTKISGVSAMWKQKQEGVQTTLSDQSLASALKTSLVDDKFKNFPAKATTGITTAGTTTAASVTAATVPKKIQGVIHTKQSLNRGMPDEASFAADSKYILPAKNSAVSTGGSGVTTTTKKLEGVIHSRDGSANSIQAVAGNPFDGDYHPSETLSRARQMSSSTLSASVGFRTIVGATSNKADSPAVVSYGGTVTGGRRRFTETPQSGYRDRAAERRNLHGASLPGDA